MLNNGFSESIDKLKDAEKRLLNGARLLTPHDDGRHILHIMPHSEPGWYTDTYSAWIVDRDVWRADHSKMPRGAQIYFTGSELLESPSQEWFDDRIMEALARMEEFPDGGVLPVNDPRDPIERRHG